MPRKKSHLGKAVKPTHLAAIGKVAAEWSLLEAQIMHEISDLAKVPFQTGVYFLMPLNIHAWMDLMKVFLPQGIGVIEATRREKQFGRLQAHLFQLHGERNGVVHAFWRDPSLDLGLRGLLSMPLTIPPERAEGFGFPKRGTKGIVTISKTPEEIRDIAKRIEAARSAIALLVRPTTQSLPQMRAAWAILDPQDQGRTGKKPQRQRKSSHP